MPGQGAIDALARLQGLGAAATLARRPRLAYAGLRSPHGPAVAGEFADVGLHRSLHRHQPVRVGSAVTQLGGHVMWAVSSCCCDGLLRRCLL